MKIFRLLASGAVVVLLATSCLSDKEPYNAGFTFWKPASQVTAYYANNTSDSLVFFSYGPWAVGDYAGYNNSWIDIPVRTGKGGISYSMPVNIQQNRTGMPRPAVFLFEDTNHPSEANGMLAYWQYATRGDGSLGNAALVKSISSTDLWSIDISYDEKARPVHYMLFNPRGYQDNVKIDYNEREGTITVTSEEGVMTGSMDNAYQTEMLKGAKDTIGYYSQYYSNGMPMAANNAFNLVSSHKAYGHRLAYSYLLNGQSLAPDSLHNADSLKFQRHLDFPEFDLTERLKLVYSNLDNRCQSVDVNQLLLGMINCEPLQLLSLFRYTRSTSIVKEALSADGNIEVTTELNSDKSVHRMEVKRGDRTVIYSFTYWDE